MRDARRAALLSRWAAGSRLSPEEREEIADIIAPAAPAAATPAQSPTPPATATAPSFALESPPAAAFSSRSGCIHPLIPGTPYEQTFGKAIRTIKRWRSAGASHTPPAYPPLDEPHRMAAWWRLVMTNEVPARLLQLEEAAPASTPAPAATPSASPTTSPSAPATPTPAADPSARSAPAPIAPRAPRVHLDAPPDTGYAATLNRLSQAEAVAAQRYTEAVLSPDETVRANATALKREWLELADTTRTYERDRAKILRESGETWDRSAVIEAVTSVHNVIAPGIRRLWRQVRRRHPDFLTAPPAQQDEIFARETDALFGVLLNTAFTTATVPAAEIPEPVSDPINNNNSTPTPAAAA